MTPVYWLFAYLLGVFLTFVVSFIVIYLKVGDEYVMLPEPKSIYSQLSANQQGLLIVGIVLFPVAIVCFLVYFFVCIFIKLPIWVVKLILNVFNIGKSKVIEGKVALLTVGDIVHLARYDDINEFDNKTITEIGSYYVKLSDDVKYAKKNFVLYDNELFLAAHPYGFTK
jgi:hypothetical protein